MNKEKPSRPQEEIVRTGISLPKSLLDQFDHVLQDTGYRNRSQAIRDILRDFILDHTKLQRDKGKKVGAFIVLFNHAVENIADKLTEVQHHYLDVILFSTHIHLTNEKCLEIIILEGDVESISAFSKRLVGEHGIIDVKSMLIDY